MRIPRFIVDSSLSVGTAVNLTGADLHHLKNVLRSEVGAQIELVQFSTRKTFTGELTDISAETAIVILQTENPISSLPRIHLICGLPKGSVTDFITEKVTELGATSLTFFEANRTQGRLSNEKLTSRLERLRRIVEAATKQSGAAGLLPNSIQIAPRLSVALGLLHSAKPSPGPLEWRVQCSTSPNAQNPLSLLQTQPAENIGLRPSPLKAQSGPQLISPNASQEPTTELERISQNAESYLVIGPEGGLDQEELTLLDDYHYQPISLGPTTLRAETAVIVACALIGILRTAR